MTFTCLKNFRQDRVLPFRPEGGPSLPFKTRFNDLISYSRKIIVVRDNQ